MDSNVSGQHQQYLFAHYKKLADQLLSREVTAEQFAQSFTQIHFDLEKRTESDGLLLDFLNNKGLTKALTEGLQITQRFGLLGTLLALDIDYLKKFNDTFGHVEGDKLIRVYADTIKQHIRNSDLRGRVGGDEFVVFLIGSSIENAQEVAERIRVSIMENTKVAFPNLSWEQTISIGIAGSLINDTPESLRERADKALYRSKETGKNKVTLLDKFSP